jgi:hypothetical protein
MSDELGIGEITTALEDEDDLQQPQRLGVCQPCEEGRIFPNSSVPLTAYDTEVEGVFKNYRKVT